VRTGNDLTGRLGGDVVCRIAGGEAVLGIHRASWEFAVDAAAQIGLEVGALRGVGVLFALFQGPLLLGGINQPEVVDTGVLLRSGAGFDEVGDCNRGQQTDDGDNDHDLHEGKTCLATNFLLHGAILSIFLGGVNSAKGGFI